jgi:translocation protein SEC62
VPPIGSEADACALLGQLIPYTFFLRVDVGNSIPAPASASSQKKVKALQINPMQSFDPSFRFAWFYEGSQLKVALGAFGMVALILAGVMFPLWPTPLRIGVWYLSLGVLGLIGLFFGLAIFRLIFYVITLVVAKPGIWIFPKLFDDVGVVR